MKKIASLIGAGALLLSVAGVAFAKEEITVNNNGGAHQYTTANANSNTGYNKIEWPLVSGGFISTGPALSESVAQSMANQFATLIGADCGCFGEITVSNHGVADQHTTANANSNTGYNTIEGWDEEGENGGTIHTGGAGSSAVSQAWANIFHTQIMSF